MPDQDADVIVVGAGLSGLACARRLHEAGLAVVVLEKGDAVGGRVRTDVVDGYRLDRGFQVINPSYPALPRVVRMADLDLRPLDPGVMVATGSSRYLLADPRRRPGDALDALRAPVGSLRSKLRLAMMATRAALTPVSAAQRWPESSTADALRARGIDAQLTRQVLRPFLSGVFLEPHLETSSRFFDLVLRSFVRGVPGVPATGMQRLSDLVAAPLPKESIRLETPVERVTGPEVRTPDGRLAGRAVVVATDPSAASQLIPGLPQPATNGVTTWYHSVPQQEADRLLGGRACLVIDGDGRGPVVNSVVLSQAASDYAPHARALVSSSALGVDGAAGDETLVRRHLAVMYGRSTAAWECVRRVPVRHALPAMPVPLDVRKPVRVGSHYVCGDHRDTSSIQGAIVSGRRAASAVLSDLA